MTSSTRQFVLAIAALIGITVTWYYNLQFIAEKDGLSLREFLAACYINAASCSISSDLIVATFTFLFWSYTEAKRLNMKTWWLSVVLTFGVAIAFAFPLFMLMREKKIARPS